MIRSRRRAYGMAAGLFAVGAVASCMTAGGRAEALKKYTAEREGDTLSAPPAKLGGPLDPTGSRELKVRPTPPLMMNIHHMTEPDLVAHLKKIEYDTDLNNSEIAYAQCVHVSTGQPCAINDDGANVYIQPDIGIHKWKHSDVPPNGFIVARIINYDPERKEIGFGIPPHTRVWWLVDHDTITGALQSRFFRRTYVASAPIEWIGVTRGFRDCGHGFPKLSSKAHWTDCARSNVLYHGATRGDAVQAPATRSLAPSARPVSFTSAVPLPNPPQQAVLLDAAWVTCELGCCATS